MKEIQWTDELSLGITEIDSEHKHLIEIANKIIFYARESNTVILKKLFHELRGYTFTHFRNEENYMSSIKYNQISEHKCEHENLKKQVKQFQEILFKGDIFDGLQIKQFMKSWLIDHIIYSDMKIKKFLLKTIG